MKCIIYVSLLLIFALQIHCYPKDPEDHSFQDGDGHEISHEVPSITNYQKIAPNNADFATRLYKEIITNSTAENVFLSPLSISTAFALLCLGAKAETHSQIYKGLTFNLTEIKEMEIQNGFRQVIEVLNRPGNKAKVNIGNALFINESLKVLPKFLDDVKTLYAAEGFSVNFKNSTIAKDKINNYVQNKTHGKIDNALDDLDENAVMVILNYIFFQGYWKNPFHAYMTKEEDFFVNGSTTVKVNMMFQEAYFQVLRDEDLSCWVVKMPYKGKASAWFILPDEGKMNDVEKQLQKEILTKWMTSVRNRMSLVPMLICLGLLEEAICGFLKLLTRLRWMYTKQALKQQESLLL
ncbi:alpha-1-antitrypsin-like isoform X2 [Hemicordylus capensis]|uniref:alpha-1-antitrypsin-like isoform X2 n=1 Tax=Hemicordylus capensis TaxID=884348 RepID=UPI002302BEBB|nr:alpha-1-antitrypsin-like isoform X2 [Hemicordylus capensis]